MGQDEGSRRALVDTRRASQTDETFKPFESKFDSPAQPVKGKDIGSGEGFRIKRGDHDHPIASGERTLRYLITAFAGGRMCLLGGFLGCRLRAFLCGPD